MLLTLPVAGCGDDNGGSAAVDALPVVATTAVVADLAQNVGGDRADVTGLMGPNVDPHAYELRPRDMEAIADADVVLRSGGDLDEWLQDAIKSSGTDAPVVTLTDHVQTRAGDHGHEDEEQAEHAEEEAKIDAHWWQDPRNAERAVIAIRDGLIKADPAGDAQYRANADAYIDHIRALDRAVQKCIDQVPPDRRKLVTTHDSLSYYAARYGIEVIGAVIPAVTTAGQPSAGETVELVQTIRAEGVDVIFAESSVNPSVEEAIARESGARLGEALWADTLGPQGSTGATYLDSIAANTRALVDGFTDGAQSCSLPR